MTTSICGAVDLLSAIFCEDKERMRLRFGLPLSVNKYKCLNCGKIVYRTSPVRFCSGECRRKYNIIQVSCSECGALFPLGRYDLNDRTKNHKISEIFCSRKCFGRYVGRNYGFGAHPEHCSIKARSRKWNYGEIKRIRQLTGWGATRISRYLSIPESSVGKILRKIGAT